jgi:hypothetical protein
VKKPDDQRQSQPTVASVRKKLEQGKDLTAADHRVLAGSSELAALVAAIRRRNGT